MFHLIGSTIWIVGFVVVANFLLSYFDRHIDWDYVKESQSRCFGAVTECRENVARDGEEATCRVACFEFSKLVERNKAK